MTVTTPGEGTFTYDYGTSVPVVATADLHYHFVNWTGTAVTAGKVADPTAASTTVTMEGDYTLVANFAIDQVTLTPSSTAGGDVTTPGEGHEHRTNEEVEEEEDRRAADEGLLLCMTKPIPNRCSTWVLAAGARK